MQNETILRILVGMLALLTVCHAATVIIRRIVRTIREKRDETKAKFFLHIYEAFEIWDPAIGPMPQHMQEMLELIKEYASEPNRHPGIYWVFAMVYMMEDKPWYDHRTVFRILESNAEQDEPECQFLLGTFLKQGGKGFKPDPVTGEDWLRKSRENGIAVPTNIKS